MTDPMREVLVQVRSAAERALDLADEAVRAYDRATDPPLFPRSFTAPYLTEAAEQEARGEDTIDRERAGA